MWVWSPKLGVPTLPHHVGLREDGSHWRRERPIQNYVYFTLKVIIKEGSCYKRGVFEFCTEHFPSKKTCILELYL